MIHGLVNLVIYLIVLGVILGLLLYLVRISPVPEPWKGWLWFVVVAVGVIIVIYLLLGLIGDTPKLRLGDAGTYISQQVA
jgi:hypothetical protein